MTDFAWKDYPSGASISITLNNTITAGALSLGSTVINNTGSASGPLTRYDSIDVEVILASLAATANYIEGWLVPSLDGTNFQTVDATARPVAGGALRYAQAWVVSGTSAKRGVLQFDGLRPRWYKFLFCNSLGVTLANSGNSANWRGTVRETR